MNRSVPFLLAFALSGGIQAQSPVVVTDYSGNVVNGTTIVAWGAAGAFEMGIGLHTESDETGNQFVNVKRYELNVVDSTKNYFCWGVCYNPIYAGEQTLWVSDDVVNMDPDSVYTAFHAYYRPEGREGASCFRYVWFSTSNDDDSTWVDICFNTNTGIGEGGSALARFEVYPNPAQAELITFRHSFNGSATRRDLVVYDLLGNVVAQRTIAEAQTTTLFTPGALNAGVYFATVRADGEVLGTLRFTVVGR